MFFQVNQWLTAELFWGANVTGKNDFESRLWTLFARGLDFILLDGNSWGLWHDQTIISANRPKKKKISFGGIPNSSNIDILMPYAIFLRSGFAHVDNVIPVIKAITWLLLSRLQGNKPHRNFPEFSEPFLLNLRQHTPEPSEIFQNLPELASGTYTVLHRNSPEPSGTCLGNLHHFTKELSGIFRNPPPEPTPAHSGTLRNFPEPSSGTGSCDPHRHTPELIWAEDPISLRCWGKSSTVNLM